MQRLAVKQLVAAGLESVGAHSDCSAVQVPPAPRNRHLLLSAHAANHLEFAPFFGRHGWSGVPDRHHLTDASASLDLGKARAYRLPGFEGLPGHYILKLTLVIPSQS